MMLLHLDSRTDSGVLAPLIIMCIISHWLSVSVMGCLNLASMSLYWNCLYPQPVCLEWDLENGALRRDSPSSSKVPESSSLPVRECAYRLPPLTFESHLVYIAFHPNWALWTVGCGAINDYDWLRGDNGSVQADYGVAWPQLCPTVWQMILTLVSLRCPRRPLRMEKRRALSNWNTV